MTTANISNVALKPSMFRPFTLTLAVIKNTRNINTLMPGIKYRPGSFRHPSVRCAAYAPVSGYPFRHYRKKII